MKGSPRTAWRRPFVNWANIPWSIDRTTSWPNYCISYSGKHPQWNCQRAHYPKLNNAPLIFLQINSPSEHGDQNQNITSTIGHLHIAEQHGLSAGDCGKIYTCHQSPLEHLTMLEEDFEENYFEINPWFCLLNQGGLSSYCYYYYFVRSPVNPKISRWNIFTRNHKIIRNHSLGVARLKSPTAPPLPIPAGSMINGISNGTSANETTNANYDVHVGIQLLRIGPLIIYMRFATILFSKILMTSHPNLSDRSARYQRLVKQLILISALLLSMLIWLIDTEFVGFFLKYVIVNIPANTHPLAGCSPPPLHCCFRKSVPQSGSSLRGS